MIAPQGDFCDATKVTKNAVKEREFRFSLSLTILSLKTTKKGAAAPLFGKSPKGAFSWGVHPIGGIAIPPVLVVLRGVFKEGEIEIPLFDALFAYFLLRQRK